MAQLDALAGAASSVSHRDAAWLAYAVLSALPWLSNPTGTLLAGRGGGDPSVAAAVQGVIDECRATAGRLLPPRSASGVHFALTEDRQQQLDVMFDAMPSESARTSLPALGASALQQLLGYIDDALSAHRHENAEPDASRVGDDDESGSRFCQLAVCSIARPADDSDVASLVMRPPQPRPLQRARPLGGADGAEREASAHMPGLAEAAVTVPADVDDDIESAAAAAAALGPAVGDDVDSPPEGTAAAAEDGGRPALLAIELPLVRWELGTWCCGVPGAVDGAAAALAAADAVFPVGSADDLLVRPPFHLFGGPGGLSSTPALMRAMGLDGPAATPLALWALREVGHDVLLTHYPLLGAAAEALARLPQGAIVGARGGRALPVFPVALDCALSQALWLPRAPHPPVFYSLVVARLVAAASSADGSDGGGGAAEHVTVVVGMAARIFWKYAPLLDDCVVDRLCSLLAHHVSVNKWDWVWAEWARVLLPGPAAAPPHSTQRRLLETLLHRTFALVGPYHYERIVTAHMPPELRAAGLLPVSVTVAAQSPLLPTGAAAAAASESPAGAAVPAPLLELASEVLAKLRAKAEAAELSSWLALRSATDAAAGVTPLLTALVVAHCVLMHGRANLKHAQTLFERYKPILLASAAAGESAVVPLSADVQAHVLLAAVWEVWRRARHVALAICDQLCQLGIVTPAQLVSFAIAPSVRFPVGHWHASDEAQPGDAAGEETAAEVESPSQPPLEYACLRSLSLGWWELAEHALDLGTAAAGAAHVALAVFRGAGILDPKDDELTVGAAEVRDTQLAAAVVRTGQAKIDAIISAISMCSTSVPRLLDAAAGSPAAGDAGDRYSEAARVVLSHLRSVCRNYAPELRDVASSGALASARANCSHVAQLLDAALVYVPSVRTMASPLARDTLLVALDGGN